MGLGRSEGAFMNRGCGFRLGVALLAMLALAAGAFSVIPSQAAPAGGGRSQDAIQKAQDSIAKGLNWLKSQQDPKTHAWAKGQEPVALNALALKAFVQNGYKPD